MENETKFKSGFVAIVGPTNSGKSTLINALVGHKVSIVSNKVQTTYHGIRGVLNTKHSQVVFIDTPGFQSYAETVARLLNKVADRNAQDSDRVIWVFDASNSRVLSQIEKMQKRISEIQTKDHRICVLNKVDLVKKENLLPILEQLYKMELFEAVVPMSAMRNDGVKNLLSVVEAMLPEGEPLFPQDLMTDRPKEFMMTEFIREKIYRSTHQEIPYSAWIEIEQIQPAGEVGKTPVIYARIHVDADNRKGILIGKAGEMLKRIGTEARRDIENLIGEPICLKLHVDVKEDWRRDSRHLNQYLELA